MYIEKWEIWGCTVVICHWLVIITQCPPQVPWRVYAPWFVCFTCEQTFGGSCGGAKRGKVFFRFHCPSAVRLAGLTEQRLVITLRFVGLIKFSGMAAFTTSLMPQVRAAS